MLRSRLERVTLFSKLALRWGQCSGVLPAVVVLNLLVRYAALSPIWRQLDLDSDGDAGRAHAAQASEELVGRADVFGDLRAQFFRAAEFFFLAQTFPEMDLDPAGCRLAERLEDVGLNALG